MSEKCSLCSKDVNPEMLYCCTCGTQNPNYQQDPDVRFYRPIQDSWAYCSEVLGDQLERGEISSTDYDLFKEALANIDSTYSSWLKGGNCPIPESNEDDLDDGIKKFLQHLEYNLDNAGYAIRYYQQIQEIDPKNIWSLIKMARLYKKIIKTIYLYQHNIGTCDSLVFSLLRAGVASETGYFGLAVSCYEKLFKIDPKNITASTESADLYNL